ncbi:MAG: hypothetical protein HYW63_05170 [Candidatus Levybacteria bacterium]|nr:hypothetical protein [Candidatus Levybacteria bacterium]
MLPQKTITKKQKKQKIRKQLFIGLIFIGLIVIFFILFYLAFLQKTPEFFNPLSRNQTSTGFIIRQTLMEKKINYKSISTSKDLTYRIVLDNNSEVIIDPKKNVEEQLSSLQLILARLKIEGKMFKRLDFRYQKPIISF